MEFISGQGLFWVIVVFLLSAYAAFFFYKDVKWLKTKNTWRSILIALRGMVLFTLILLLLNLWFESNDFRNEKPILFNLIDNSTSIKNYKDSSQVKQLTTDYLKASKERLAEKFEVVDVVFGQKIRYHDSVDFKDVKTDISAPFQQILNDYYGKNIGGFVLMSDGNYNEGQHPSYAIENIGFSPIYVLGVGDTIPKKDQYIKHITINDFAILNNEFPVEVDLESMGFANQSTKIQILENGRLLQEQTVQYQQINDYRKFVFNLKASTIGFHKYEVKLVPLKGEFTLKNNIKNCYLEVIDGRSKIVLVSASPHPDLGVLKNVLKEDQNYEVDAVTWNEWDKKFSKVNLMVWLDPQRNQLASIQESVHTGISNFFIFSPFFDVNTFHELNIGRFQGRERLDEVGLSLNNGFQLFEINDEIKEMITYSPPFNAKYGKLKVGNGASVFAYQSVGQIQKEDPLIYFGKQNQTKYGVCFGDGLWRWRLNEFKRVKNTEQFDVLIRKMMQYLVVKKEDVGLRIQLPKSFNRYEEIIIDGEFYNENLEKITTPTVKFELKNNNKTFSKSQFAIHQDGYRLNLGTLEPGLYTWKASTTFNQRNYIKKGVFIIEDVSIESIYSTMNYDVLKMLSSQNEGRYFNLKNYEQCIETLLNRKDITSVAYEQKQIWELIDWKWLLLLVLLFYALELIFRRYLGAY